MIKEQLARDYANRNFESTTYHYTDDKRLTDFDKIKEAYIDGYEKGQPKWITVEEETPPIHTELLVKAPNGIIHLANWRESYNIFTCQNKNESSYDWQWMQIPQ